MNGAAYYIVAHGHSYIWLVPLLAAAFAASHIAERLYPCYEEWNQSHGDVGTNTLHLFVYEGSNIVGVLLIPLISWLFHLKPGPSHVPRGEGQCFREGCPKAWLAAISMRLQKL